MARYKGFKKIDIINKLEAIKKAYGINVYNILIDFIKESDKPYLSYSKNICFRSFGSICIYDSLITELNLNYNWPSPGLRAESTNKLFDIEYVEHDIILALK